MKDKSVSFVHLSLFLIVCFPFFRGVLFAQNQNYVIDYYGIVSKDLDSNMSSMISDLYYTQLSEIQNFTIHDKRTSPCSPEIPDFSSLNTKNFIFYTKIDKEGYDDSWSATFVIVDKSKNQQYSKQKSYNSFYRIFMESKNELGKIVKGLVIDGKPDIAQFSKTSSDIQTSGNKIAINSVESLSGTWKGTSASESSIDKIVILRGGRGFIIFNNGASMSITVHLENNNGEQKIIIKQKGNSNPSFYPELSRKVALKAAVSAPPMEWTMQLLDNMVLKGEKTTLIQDGESFKSDKVEVTWKKQS